MKKLTKYNRVAGYLLKVFRRANDRFFGGELPEPTITIQSTPGAYGHFCTDGHLWRSVDGDTYEININADKLDRPIENIITTLVHEMCHLYNHINGVQDCSRGGTYHNKHFKATAEACGLQVEYDKRVGHGITSPGDVMLDWILQEGFADIEISRCDSAAAGDSKPNAQKDKPKNHSIKYQCPICKCSVRATKKVNICCMDCIAPMIPADELA